MKDKVRYPNVYVVNKSSHNFEPAKRFGNLIYMTEGVMNRFETNDMIRRFVEALRDSQKCDYILPCSLSIMNALACSVFAHKHGALNLLLYKNGSYIERNHLL
jgi:hypothetical protein